MPKRGGTGLCPTACLQPTLSIWLMTPSSMSTTTARACMHTAANTLSLCQHMFPRLPAVRHPSTFLVHHTAFTLAALRYYRRSLHCKLSLLLLSLHANV